MSKIFITILLLFACSAGLILADFVFASNTDGTIDSAYKYAWGENTGWVNFGTANGNVHITDSGLSGYGLGETIGWLYLGDITNDGEGNLSGYAWSENTGWINFNPIYGGVIINSSGEFAGSALGENIGWIIFDCSTSACVKTDWRPQSARPACNNAADDDNDGRTDYPNDPGCSSLGDDDETDISGTVILPSFIAPSPQPPAPVAEGPAEPEPSEVELPTVEELAVEAETIIKIPEIIKKIEEISEEIERIEELVEEAGAGELEEEEPSFVEPAEGEEEIEEKLEPELKALPALEQLPENVQEIARKFPQIGDALVKLKITTKQDVERLKNVPFIRPNLKELFAQKKPELAKQEITFQEPVKPEIKEIIPDDTLFFTGSEDKIHFHTNITSLDKEKPVNEIRLVSGHIIKIVIKPSQPVKGIRAQFALREKPQSTNYKPTTFNCHPEALAEESLNLFEKSFENISRIRERFFPRPCTHGRGQNDNKGMAQNDSLGTSSFFDLFLSPVWAKDIETRFVLAEFELTDPDGDGIYTAEIQAPLVSGEYEIITFLDYQNPALEDKELRIITLIDPEGYIYERTFDGKEARIPNAKVSLFYLNPQTQDFSKEMSLEISKYELWPAVQFQQQNPQITKDTGEYSFLVPEGTYFLKVEAENYLTYQSEPFMVIEGEGIHKNIELKKSFLQTFRDWRMVAIILLAIISITTLILLFYNFYRDRMFRKKLVK